MSWLPKPLREIWEIDDPRPFRLRLFLLMCLTACGLSLFIVLPLNLIIGLPGRINLIVLLYGAFSGFCYVASRRGHHWFVTFLLGLIAILDPIWLWNGGSSGSISFYFFPILLYPMALFRGRRRWLLIAGIILNLIALHCVEYLFPGLVTPYAQPIDRLLDLITGAFSCSVAVVIVSQVIISNYDHEQERIQRYNAELETSERKYREIFNATTDAMLILSPDGRILDGNGTACSLTGYNRSSLLSLGWAELGAAPNAATLAAERIDAALHEGPQAFEWLGRHQSGSAIWTEAHLSASTLGGQMRLIAVVHDISERKSTVEALRRNAERLQLALEATSQGWFELNVQTGAGISSAEYIRMIGEDPKVFATTYENWRDGVHPDDRTQVTAVFQDTVRTGQTGTVEYRHRTAAGEWLWIRSIGRIVEYDESGRPLLLLGTHANITERKRLEQRLVHSQRLESIGTLAGGIAHDLNNILTPMLMAGDLLQDSLTQPHDRQNLAMLQREAKRGAAIVRQLLLFSRNVEGALTAQQLRTPLADIASMMRETLSRQILVTDLAPKDLWLVEADATQIQQVLLNLCLNARDAMPGGGSLTLRAENIPAELVPADPSGQLRQQPCVCLSVSDTGTGMSPEIVDRIFDPFFTTKGIGKGTGLGLSTVHGIVQAHKGIITVESQLGKGTTFRIFLPAQIQPQPKAESVAPATRAGGGETVMVVDDESVVLSVTRRFLERSGFRVIPAGSGAEALALFPIHAADIRLVITDLMMPGMDGLALAAQLRIRSPQLPIIGVSGLHQNSRPSELAKLGFAEVLLKPYEPATLMAAVRRHLPAR